MPSREETLVCPTHPVRAKEQPQRAGLLALGSVPSSAFPDWSSGLMAKARRSQLRGQPRAVALPFYGSATSGFPFHPIAGNLLCNWSLDRCAGRCNAFQTAGPSGVGDPLQKGGMVGAARIELATPAMSTQCSTTELRAPTKRRSGRLKEGWPACQRLSQSSMIKACRGRRAVSLAALRRVDGSAS